MQRKNVGPFVHPIQFHSLEDPTLLNLEDPTLLNLEDPTLLNLEDPTLLNLEDHTLLSLEDPTLLTRVHGIPLAQIQMVFCPHTLVVTH